MFLGQPYPSLEAQLIAELELEARQFIEQVFGAAYDLIPDAVKRQLEQEYLKRRIAEERARIGAVGAKVAPAALAIVGGLLMLFLLGRR